MPEPVPLGRPTVGEEELAAVAEVFASGWLAGAGSACRRFEERLAAATGTAHALATSSWGAALFRGLRVLGVRPGDEVIVGDHTFPATSHAVRQAGASTRGRRTCCCSTVAATRPSLSCGPAASSASDLFRRHLALPKHAGLADEQVARVIESVRDVVGEL
ncbi:hypothetical protein GCM10017786_36180 [Amycolatopsis deserti]|uniref:Uncharacterized protein n=1 Tax=Amycolatopsis deserti TaxID=185696 RepID=A0ABQ3J050_9PSEU|nr:hypothetical protein GCM10017786_36180 [Amycolatopsis deserti]